jgi:plasmid stabilization system protein ParE
MISVYFSPKAKEDLREIGDYIARDNPIRAGTFLDEILQSCDFIGSSPETFPLRPRLGTGIRRTFHKRYAIYYRVLLEEIRIERVIHGARNITSRDFRN